MTARDNLVNKDSERTRLLRDFSGALLKYPDLTCAFSLWWVWIFLTYQSTQVFPVIVVGSGRVPSCVGPVLCIAVALLGMAMVYRKTRFVLKDVRYFAGIGATMAFASLVVVAWHYGMFYRGALSAYAFASVLLGLSSGFMYAEFNRALGWLGTLKTIYLSIAAMFLSSSILLLLSAVPAWCSVALFAVSPLLMCFFLYRAISSFPSGAYFGMGQTTPLRLPGKFIATSAVQGLSFGVVFGALIVGGFPMLPEWGSLLAHVAAVALLFFAVIFIKMDFNRLIYQTSFPMMAFGLLLMCCLAVAPYIGGAFYMVGFALLDLMLWALGSYLIKNASIPAVWVTGMPSGVLFSCLGIGYLFGSLYVQQTLDRFTLPVFAAVLSFAILLSALLLISSRNLEYGWGTIRLDDMKEADTSTEDQVVLYLVNEHGLTSREADILGLIVRGVPRKAISEELFVSENTVKTHTRNAYRKLGVANRSELDRLVADTRSFLVQ